MPAQPCRMGARTSTVMQDATAANLVVSSGVLEQMQQDKTAPWTGILLQVTSATLLCQMVLDGTWSLPQVSCTLQRIPLQHTKITQGT